jgi:hypothetical protein
MSKPLLVHFCGENQPDGVSRGTLKDLADALGVSQTKAVHYAIRLAHSTMFDKHTHGEVTPAVFMSSDVTFPVGDRIIRRQTILEITQPNPEASRP